MKFTYIAMILLICTAFTVFPVMAGEKYLSGKPEMSVAISGTNEFEPGDDTTLTVIVQNTGTKTFKIINSDIIDRDDVPDTAKLVSVSLNADNAPINVKTDPQMIGDVDAGDSVTAAFKIKVDKYAEPGNYDLITTLTYKYLSNADQIGQDSLKYYYKDMELPLTLKIKIKPDLQIEVLNIVPDSMNVGAEGYITMDVKNVGYEIGENSVIKLTKAEGSAVVPTDSSVYVGEFAPGDIKTVTFKAAVSSDGEAKNYPVLVSVEYKDSDGVSASSDSETVGVDVGGKVDFKIVSEPAELNPGQKGHITIVYKNTGATTAYNAQARISAVDPFTSNDDTAYLGDIAPGETATGIYEVSVDSDATIKTFAIDTEIRYRDSLDNSQISDSMKAEVQIVKRSGMEIFTNPILLTVIVFLIIGAGYFVWSRRKK
ncbi:MAG: S-layer protein [Methanomicrobiaceae archaeon]|nr:S-layer protein [Methanomicrobiaceae archaeon]